MRVYNWAGGFDVCNGLYLDDLTQHDIDSGVMPSRLEDQTKYWSDEDLSRVLKTYSTAEDMSDRNANIRLLFGMICEDVKNDPTFFEI